MKVSARLLTLFLAFSSLSAWAEEPRYACSFETSHCASQIYVCVDPTGHACRNRLVVSCQGSTIYDGDFVAKFAEWEQLFQGITSDRFPTPPAITVQPGDLDQLSGGDRLDAHLFSARGISSGSCRRVDP